MTYSENNKENENENIYCDLYHKESPPLLKIYGIKTINFQIGSIL